MLASLPQLARALGRILAGRPAPVDPSTITDPLAVYSFVMGYEADRVNMLGITHTLKLARRWRENPHERIVTPKAEARFVRALQVAPQVLAIDAEMRALQTPEGSRAHWARLAAGLPERRQQEATPEELRAMSRTSRIRHQLDTILIAEIARAKDTLPTPPMRPRPFLAAQDGRLTSAAQAARATPR
jgi:hypothetical protein